MSLERFILAAMIALGSLGAGAQPAPPASPLSIDGGELIAIHAFPFTLRGDAPPGTEVELVIGDESRRAVADPDGRWEITLDGPLPSGNQSVTLRLAAAPDTAVATVLRNETGGTMPRRPLLPPPDEEAVRDVYATSEIREMSDRWAIAPPPGYEMLVQPKGGWDPYNQHRLKGDRPFRGEDIFLSLTGISDTLVETRDTPVPSGVSAEHPGSIGFFGDGEQIAINQNVTVSADLYRGLTTFRPADWRARATIVANFNHLEVRERAAVSPDVRRGIDRSDGQLAVQELFYERKLADLSPRFDFVSVRAGVQPFVSDFRGFLFADSNLGVRLFGNYASNRWQYNLALFERLEKDTNSGLNELHTRGQSVAIANVYRQDFIVPGLTATASVHWMRDEGDLYYDSNGALVRPDPIGDFRTHEIEAAWLGGALFGKFGRINVDGAAYFVTGDDSHNPIAGDDPLGGGTGLDGATPRSGAVDISASMAALELSYDRDWLRPRIGFFYASGDGDPTDRDAEGFDAIFPNPAFAGGGFSFWNRLGIRLPMTGVGLVHRGSLLPDLTSSKDEGQPNFVNPGVQILTAGLDIDLTPKTKLIFTGNWLRFSETATLEQVLFQSGIDGEIGIDLSGGVRWRPFLNQNAVVLGGVAIFLPGAGFEDVFHDDRTLYQLFTNLVLTF